MKKYSIIFVLSLSLFLLVKIPANLLMSNVGDIKGIHISQLEGTIWKGSAKAKEFVLLEWDFLPWRLFTGQGAIKINLKIDKDNHLQALAFVNANQQLALKEISGNITTNYLQQLMPNTPFMFQSDLSIEKSDLGWEDFRQLTALNTANIALTAHDVNLMGERIGAYNASINYKDQQLAGNINSTQNSSINTKLKLTLVSGNKLRINGSTSPRSKKLRQLYQQLKLPKKINYIVQIF